MSVKEIPKAYEYTCDQCGVTHRQENASGHYSNSTPPDWMSLLVRRYNKVPVDILLCDRCEATIIATLGEGACLPKQLEGYLANETVAKV